MWARRKLESDQFFREIVVFLGECHSFLVFIYGFDFDGEMVGNVGDFFAVNIRSLTKYTLGGYGPVVTNWGSSGRILWRNQQFSGFFLKYSGIWDTLALVL